jgi:hypothetical protein
VFSEDIFQILLCLQVKSGMEPYPAIWLETRLYWLSFHSQSHDSYLCYSLTQCINYSQLQKLTNHA